MLTEINIQGYRTHRDLTVKPTRKFNVIAGVNGAGHALAQVVA